jgi:triphosphoribosyl-dephospho-CoA synthase
MATTTSENTASQLHATTNAGCPRFAPRFWAITWESVPSLSAPVLPLPLPTQETHPKSSNSCLLQNLADTAAWALIEEAELTPKPGLVDQRGSGAHCDMNLAMLRLSATALHPTFLELAQSAHGVAPSINLRRALGAIGREGEATMLRVTGGCNTHRGAIWTLGLLCAAAASLPQSKWSANAIAAHAADISRLPDSPPQFDTHGALACQRFGVRGARGEAAKGFPHVINRALPALRASRTHCAEERLARLNALLTIMTTLDDTCLLHRGGAKALAMAQRGASRVLLSGGAATPAGMRALLKLDRELVAANCSPGGSADLLAATLFLDRLAGGK